MRQARPRGFLGGHKLGLSGTLSDRKPVSLTYKSQLVYISMRPRTGTHRIERIGPDHASNAGNVKVVNQGD